VVQEAITNAVRHADASEIAVKVTNLNDEFKNNWLTIEIVDDGKGMEIHDFHSDVDFGLLGMKERAQSLGGQFKLESSLGNGVRIQIKIPLGVEKI
jgi:signal transduction histidine kinase